MIYDYSVEKSNGELLNLSDYRGKVVLIVNTASKCGFTPQYTKLQELYEKYNSQGLEIIGFPCNQFKNQEPGEDKEIQSFCQLNFGVTFPIMKKIDVNGANESPLYTYLKQAKGSVLGSKIKWNFTKFLINKEGEVVERYAPITSPEKFEDKIKELLAD